MYKPVDIGAMIHRNRAHLAAYEDQLAKVATMMPDADRDQRRRLRPVARQVKRARWRSRLAGWLLRRFDPR